MNVEKTVALGVSHALHPLLIPTYSYILLYIFYISPVFPLGTAYFILLLSAFLIFTFLLPASIIYIMYRKKMISSLHLSNRKERPLPYMASIACLWGSTWLFDKIAVVEDFLFIVHNTFFLLVAAFLVNYRFKISAHMLGMGALTAYVYLLYRQQNNNLLFVLSSIIITSGFVAHSRLFLKEHSFFEVILGYGLGIFLTFVVSYLLR